MVWCSFDKRILRAISNHRLRSFENGRVTFEWKDYAHRSRTKTMTFDAVIRRFLLHVLPQGMVRIRQFGFPRQSSPPTQAGTVPGSARHPATASFGRF